MSEQSLECSFPNSWKQLARWRALHWMGLALLLAFTATFAALSVPVRSWAFLTGEFVALTLWALPLSPLVTFRCPRCHGSFFGSAVFLLRPGCASCGLPQNTNHATKV